MSAARWRPLPGPISTNSPFPLPLRHPLHCWPFSSCPPRTRVYSTVLWASVQTQPPAAQAFLRFGVLSRYTHSAPCAGCSCTPAARFPVSCYGSHSDSVGALHDLARRPNECRVPRTLAGTEQHRRPATCGAACCTPACLRPFACSLPIDRQVQALGHTTAARSGAHSHWGHPPRDDAPAGRPRLLRPAPCCDLRQSPSWPATTFVGASGVPCMPW